MKSYFKMGLYTVWTVAICNLLLTITAIINELYPLGSNNTIRLLWVIILLFGWIIFINDVLQNKMHNKTFWIFVLLLLPSVAQILYLIKRHKIIRT